MASERAKPSAAAAEAIFAEAIGLAPAGRPSFVAQACGTDFQLRQRVEALLQAHQAPEGFLPECPAVLAARALMAATAQVVRATEQPGDTIGRYELVEKLGEGGCGVVYLAQQKEPVRRKVALKIIKLGMDTHQVVSRFEAERQALALMDHANIAKVLDAGATETGRPYFVMELVGGIKITDYCEQNHLSTHQRLELFIQVCRAVQHAHQKGIIHRDLKPSNVLVAEQDGVPIPKVIDFGIAKATQGRLTDQTLFTAFEQFLGTPAYMSPEQAQLGGLDIDTRSDIYSLGVLLYELLTGKTPFDTKELLAAGLDAMRRTIREKEPTTPSTRLKEATVARSPNAGRSEIGNCKSELHKDLDWIVMKCLEKDRARRYETANGLAMDLRRHLNNEPVVAGPPDNVYRLQKAIRRNKTVVSAAVAMATILFTGAAVSTWQAIRATWAKREAVAEKQRANEEAAKSRQVARFLQDMLQEVGPSKALGRDTAMLKEILDKTSERVASELKDQPLVAVELQVIMAFVYKDLSENLKSEDLFRQAIVTCRKHLGSDHERIAGLLQGLAMVRGAQGDISEAEALEREALAICRKAFPKGHPRVVGVLSALATRLEEQGRLKEAEMTELEALAMERKIYGDVSQPVARSLRNLGIIHKRQGRYAEAEKLTTEALRVFRRIGTPQDVAWSLQALAGVFQETGRLAEAETAFTEGLAMQRSIYEWNNLFLRETMLNLAGLLTQEGKVQEAEAYAHAAVDIQRSRGDTNPWWLYEFGEVFHKLGMLFEAEQWYREALTADSKGPRLPSGRYAGLVLSLAMVLEIQKRMPEDQSFYRDLIQGVRARLSVDDPEFSSFLWEFGAILLKNRNFIESEPLVRECLALREKAFPNDWLKFNTESLLGGCLLGQHRFNEAEPFLLSGYEGLKRHEEKIPVTGRACIKDTIQRLVNLYEATGRPAQVSRWKAELTEWCDQQLARYHEAGGGPRTSTEVARFLTTCAGPATGERSDVLAFAQREMEETECKDYVQLDALAAAYAEAGQFAKAVSIQKQALGLVQDRSVREELAARLLFYLHPYRER